MGDEQEHKQKRYDRQLRLWGAHGQAAMESTRLCLLNASPAGAEALKNLVLPGIGSYTIVDKHKVTLPDLGNNFFVDEAHLGTSRAATVSALMQELNEHVSGAYVAEDISSVLEADPTFLHAFDLVIATQLPARELRAIARICESRSIPLLAVHTYGLLGTLRVALSEHPIVEAHPDHSLADLRVLAPPAGLLRFVAERYADFGALTSAEHAHVPYVVLLIRAVGEWSAANGGASPSSYAHKKQVRTILQSYQRSSDAQPNVEEALVALNTALTLPAPSASVGALLASARARLSALAAEKHRANGSPPEGRALGVRQKELSFWLMAAAVDAFVSAEGAGLLPTIGTIPDMTAHTATYVELQQIYMAQASADVAAIHAYLQHIASLESLSADLVSPEQLRLFCKNTHNLTLVTYRSVEDEYTSSPGALSPAVTSALDDGASGGVLYVLLRSAQAFRAERSHWPGAISVEADVPILKQCVGEVLKELGISGSPISDDWIHEFCRWAGAELHSVGSILGGVAAQEAIKAVTHQYVPLNNTFVYNGATGTASTIEV